MTIGQRLAFWRLVLIAAASFAIVMAVIPHPPHVLSDIWDKWQHMAAFGVLTILSVLAYPRAPLHRIGERLSFLGAMIEVVQSIPVLHRDCDIMDWVADTAVIIAVLAITRVVAGRRAATP